MTRLIRAADDLLEMFGTRTEDGRRLTAEWGEPVGHCPDSDEWIYEPVFTAHEHAAPAEGLREAARAYLDAFDLPLTTDPEVHYDTLTAARDALRAALTPEDDR